MGGKGGQYLPDNSENPEHLRVALPTNPPAHGVTDAPYRCYRINSDYVSFLCAGIDYFVHSDAFIGSDLERETAAAAFVELQVLLMTGNVECGEVDGMRIRQSSTNPCVLEVSYDNGASWSVGFDYSLCFAENRTMFSAVSHNDVSTAVSIMNSLSTTYDNDYHNIAPDLHYDLSDDDALRDQAYCYAVGMLLAQLGSMLEEVEANGWSIADILDLVTTGVQMGTTLIGGLVAAGTISLSPPVIIGVTVAHIVSQFVDELIEEGVFDVNLGDFLTATQQEELQCCAMDVIGGMTPSAARFASMFNGCPHTTLTDDTITILDMLVNSEDVYLSFLATVQSAFEALKAGQRYRCPCDYDRLVFEFTTESGNAPNTYYGQGNWIVNPDWPGCGIYIPEAGWFHGDMTGGAYTNARSTYIHLPGVSGTIRSVEVIGNQALGNYENAGNVAAIRYGSVSHGWLETDAHDGDPAIYKWSEYELMDNDYIRCGIHADIRTGTEPPYAGSTMIARIIVEGENLQVSGIT